MFYQDRLWTGVRKNSKKTRYGTLKTDHRAAGGGKEMPFLAPIFHLKTIILPRQARDKHRESTLKKLAFP
jgi:hypothetical protein